MVENIDFGKEFRVRFVGLRAREAGSGRKGEWWYPMVGGGVELALPRLMNPLTGTLWTLYE